MSDPAVIIVATSKVRPGADQGYATAHHDLVIAGFISPILTALHLHASLRDY